MESYKKKKKGKYPSPKKVIVMALTTLIFTVVFIIRRFKI